MQNQDDNSNPQDTIKNQKNWGKIDMTNVLLDAGMEGGERENVDKKY